MKLQLFIRQTPGEKGSWSPVMINLDAIEYISFAAKGTKGNSSDQDCYEIMMSTGPILVQAIQIDLVLAHMNVKTNHLEAMKLKDIKPNAGSAGGIHIL